MQPGGGDNHPQVAPFRPLNVPGAVRHPHQMVVIMRAIHGVRQIPGYVLTECLLKTK